MDCRVHYYYYYYYIYIKRRYHLFWNLMYSSTIWSRLSLGKYISKFAGESNTASKLYCLCNSSLYVSLLYFEDPLTLWLWLCFLLEFIEYYCNKDLSSSGKSLTDCCIWFGGGGYTRKEVILPMSALFILYWVRWRLSSTMASSIMKF